MVKADKAIDTSIVILSGLGVLGFLGIVWLIIYGNLSTNLGFATGSAGFNNTEGVIANVSSGFNTYFGFSGVLFTIAAIVLLISFLLLLLFIVLRIRGNGKSGGDGFS